MVVLRRGEGKMASRIFFWISSCSNNDRSGAPCPDARNYVKSIIKTKKRQETWCFLSKLKQTITGFKQKFREIVLLD